MLWSAVFFFLLGALIGRLYRAPALVPATLLAAVWGVAAGWRAQSGVAQAILAALLLAVVLHAAYLVALALRGLAERPESWRATRPVARDRSRPPTGVREAPGRGTAVAGARRKS